MKILTSDMSPGGLGLYSTGPIQVGHRLTLRIPFDPPLTIGVTVVRCDANTHENRDEYPYSVGCRYNEPLPDYVLRIIKEHPERY